MLKKAQVIMLPTKKNSSNIAKSINQDILSLYNKNDDKYNQWINQHLYIISDDEIEDGDWFINLLDNSIHQATNWIYVSTCKKIIATTDTSLIENIEMIGTGSTYLFKLPQPSQQFIEKYIESYNKGEVITDVLVEYEAMNTTIVNRNYNDFEPKVNPKDNSITIKKLKENWNREEVTEILLDRGISKEWIEKNL